MTSVNLFVDSCPDIFEQIIKNLRRWDDVEALIETSPAICRHIERRFRLSQAFARQMLPRYLTYQWKGHPFEIRAYLEPLDIGFPSKYTFKQ